MGNPEEYSPHAETEFAQMEIPCYIDRTRGISLNPMIEYMKSALSLYAKDFSYDAVFHYLRSGLADVTWEETDRSRITAARQGCEDTAVTAVFSRARPLTWRVRRSRKN